MKLSRSRVLLLIEVLTSGAVVAGLWLYTEVYTSFAVARMPDVLQAFEEAWIVERATSDLLPTVQRLVIGFGIAVLAGVPLGIALGSSPLLRLLAQPAMTLIRSIPAVAIIPPLVILLGVGDGMKIFLVVIVCIWPIVLNTSDGVRQFDSTMRSTAEVYGLTPLERLRFVLIPGVQPRVFAGLRTSLALALILVIASEYLAGTNGVGYFVAQAQQSYDVASMWAGILLLGAIGYLLNAGVLLLQRRALHWHASEHAGA